MGNINFTEFDLLSANRNDFLVGHDSAGTKEIKVQVNSLLSLVQPPTNFLRKSGDTVGGKLFSVQVNPNQFTVDTEFTTKRYVDFMANKATNDAIVSLGDFSNALRPISGVITSTFPISTLNTQVYVAGTEPGYSLSVINRANFDPGEPFIVDGRARITHVMNFQAGIPLFTNGSDHSHVFWSAQGRRGWQMIQNGGTEGDNSQFGDNAIFQLVTVANNMGGTNFNETNIHSVDTRNLITNINTFPYLATNLLINFNTSAANINGTVRPLAVNELVQLSFRLGFAGIVASTYPGKVTSGPTQVTVNGETKFQYTFELTGLDAVHWLPGTIRFETITNFGVPPSPALRVLAGRFVVADPSTSNVGLTGNYLNVPRYILVEQTNHSAFVGDPVVLSTDETVLGMPPLERNAFVKDVIDSNRYIISVGNHYNWPSTTGTHGPAGWIVYRGSVDAVHQYTPATQHFWYQRFRAPFGNPPGGANNTFRTGGNRAVALGNSAETDGYFSYAIGYNSTILKTASGPVLTASSVFGGYHSFVQGSYATALGGERLIIKKDNQTALGKFNNPDTDALLVIGSGSSENSRSNILEAHTNKLSVSGSLETTGSILSAGTDLFDIFSTEAPISQTLSFDESLKNLSISGAGGNTVSLSSFAPSNLYQDLSGNWNEAYDVATAYQSASGVWQSTYTTVQANSASWEESAEILPTVTNYLSTNNVLVSSLNLSDRFVVEDQLYYTTDEAQFLGRVKLSQNNARLINVGNTWTPKDSNRNWRGIAMSSDGKYQSVVVFIGQIYVSNNYGNTWTAKDSNRDWLGIAMSSDGKYQSAVVNGGQIYVSNDYGNTWTAKESNRNWLGIAMSSDGKYQSAVVSGGQIYVSSDYGNTWSAKDSNRNWRGIAMSSDGKYQSATVNGGQIYVSNNYGNTWTAKDSNRNWFGIAMSSDGKYQSAVDGGGQIYVSVADEIIAGNLTVVGGISATDLLVGGTTIKETANLTQPSIVNGNFQNITGLTNTGGGWFTGVPFGWTSPNVTPTFAVWDGGSGDYVVNLGTLANTTGGSNSFRQNLGTLKVMSNVSVTFDYADNTIASWRSGTLNAAIYDGNFNTLATSTHSAQGTYSLTAPNVPVGTTIIVGFWRSVGNPALNNVTVTIADNTVLSVVGGLSASSMVMPKLQVQDGVVIFSNLPTSSDNLPVGAVWNNNGALRIV